MASPRPETEEIVALLEQVLAIDPQHPGAESLLHPRGGGLT